MPDVTQNGSFEGLKDAFSELGILPLGSSVPKESQEAVMQRRRAFFRREESPFAQLSLIRGPDHVLRWHEGAPGFSSYIPRSQAAVPIDVIEQQFVFEKLHDSSQVTAALKSLDDKLTDTTRRELWRWTSTGWVKFPPGQAGAFAGKRILLFIHGTFSHCDKIFDDLNDTPTGRAFLAKAIDRYDLVLTFNHPTLGVSPVVNAFTLAAHVRDIKGPAASIDVICHGRGGLVARWWLEGFADPRTRCRSVFVASPLGGTNLAAPPRLKGAFDFLTNVAGALGTGAKMTGFPLLQFVGGLIRILSSVAKVAIHSPALDAAVAAIPGLAAQSRVGNNPELQGLRSAGAWRNQTYFAVLSDFRPPSTDKWKFWKLFCDPSFALAWTRTASDLVFVDRATPSSPWKLSPNDLVVDCASMTELADNSQLRDFQDTLDYGQSSEVMHTNYFLQKRILSFIRKALDL